MLGLGIFDYLKMGAAAAAGAALAAGIVGPIQHHKGYRAGTDDMVRAVEKQNADAAVHARSARGKVGACYDAGGTWNQGEGRCDK